MKKIILILCLFVVISQNGYAWDTTAAKFLPLQVGNVWVYGGIATGYMYFDSYYTMYRITGTIDTMGVTFYVFERRLVQLNGMYSCLIWNFGYLKLRIDSSTMNIYTPGYHCNNNETFLDSLKSRKNDTVVICRYQYYNTNSICVDTTPYHIFNTYLPTKRFIEFNGPGTSTIYAKDIGVVSWHWGYGQSQCNDTLVGCVINGVLRGDTSMLVGLQKISRDIPTEFTLHQNYPNPFNPSTKIRFDVRTPLSGLEKTWISLKIYDILGRETATLVNEQLKPGSYEVEWNGTNYSSGVYWYRLISGDPSSSLGQVYIETKKMVLLK